MELLQMSFREMLYPILVIVLLICGTNASTTRHTPIVNANHVFNALNAALRQWGSSRHHNGMSSFIVSVNAGVKLYHGRGSADPVKGMEWLAFEPEHATQFAIKARFGNDLHMDKGINHMVNRAWRAPDQTVLGPRPQAGDGHGHVKLEAGYLHTYTVKHPLRLLYVDGQSAGKSLVGTLDFQDIVLQPMTLRRNHSSDERPSPPLADRPRAERLCEIAEDRWEGAVDGFVRMEMGFEVILCSFEKRLATHSIARARPPPHFPKPGQRPDAQVVERLAEEDMNYLKAIDSRRDGLGSRRASISWEAGFVSGFSVPDAIGWDQYGRPRLVNASADVLSQLRNATTEMVMNRTASATPASNSRSVNLQLLTDDIVLRYGDRIETIISVLKHGHNGTSIAEYEAELGIQPFIDYDHRNTKDEVSRCEQQFDLALLQGPFETGVAAVRRVTLEICRTFVSARSQTSTEMLASFRELRDWLGWSHFDRCRSCSVQQVCFTPMWPTGTWDDYMQPKCIGREEILSGRGGWGGDYW